MRFMLRVWSSYKYTYYWLYTWNKGLWGEEDLPQFNVLLGMVLTLFCVFYSIIIILDILGLAVIAVDAPKEIILGIGFSLLIIHYFLFVHNGKYKEIEQEFKQESKEERKRKGVWVLLYSFGAPAFFGFLLFFGIWVKH